MDRTRAITVVKVIDALIELTAVSKILNTFYAAFHEYSILKSDNMHYLHGSQKLGGTISGRLSSSDPNMSNVPSSGTKYAKPVKQCFRAALGWLMVGADYNSLEDMISALTTRDPEKMKVYTDGYDGHCLRAYSYFSLDMPDIDPSTVNAINSIKKLYPHLRQRSKVPTFCLTYGGSWKAIMEQSGIPEDEAKAIESNYHKLYHHSDTYIADKLKQANNDGYVTGAFGLRLRTPVLAKTILGQRNTPREASASGRSAGNMLGQSYGMLNNRSTNEFMQKVWDSPYKLDILPINLIHDAAYFLIRNDIEVLMFVNEHLVKAMQWQALPELQHDTVKLGGELSVFYPDWSTEIVIPNGATREEILSICSAA